MRFVKYMGIRHDYHQEDTTWYRYKELELSLEFACVNSVALETGETGLALLCSIPMKLRDSTERRGYGIGGLVPFLRREEMETGIFSSMHHLI